MTSELVSIIVPTYFRNESLREVLRSVRKQEYSPIEVIVVDDSGEGHAHDVVGEFENVLYIRLPDNRGAQAARNAGLRVATGEYVRFLDDDDRLQPTAIAKQVAVLNEHPHAGVAFCGIEYDSGDVHLPPPDVVGRVLEQALGFWNDIWRFSTLLIERSALDAIGPFEDTYEGAGDIWARIELARITEFVAVKEPLVVATHRERGGGNLGLSWTSLESRWKLLDHYATLYDEMSPEVRYHALTNTYRQEALLHLNAHPWSPRAILAFARTAYYAPTERPQHVAELAASLLGRSGYEYIRQLRDTVIRRIRG